MRRGKPTQEDISTARLMWLQGYWYDDIAHKLRRDEGWVEDLLHNDLEYKRPRYSPSVCALAKKLYEAGCTVAEVAAEMDVSTFVAQRMLWKSNTRMRRPGYRPMMGPGKRKAVKR